MSNKDQVGKIQTVTGTIDPSELGKTSTHEHIFIDFLCMFTKPDEASEQFKANQPLRLDNLGWIKYDPFRNIDNLELNNESLAVDEILKYKAVGGDSIIEATTIGIGRDPQALAKISRLTGVNIITGAGYYVDEYIPEDLKTATVDELTREIVDQVRVGCWGTDVCAGIIGEIGCMWPLRPFERKVLQAAALAQQETGASINVHPGRHREAPLEIVDVIQGVGGDVNRLVMSHIDRTFTDFDDAVKLADTGCVLEYDFFGIETSYYWFNDTDLPTDYMRLAYIRSLIERGHGRQVVVSHDICTKTRLSSFGGHGYRHIFQNVVPLMERKEFSETEIQMIIQDNPRSLLTFE